MLVCDYIVESIDGDYAHLRWEIKTCCEGASSFWYCRGKQITLWNDAVYDNRLIKLEKIHCSDCKNKQWQRPGGVAPPVGKIKKRNLF